jgi:hypothetical protein
MALMNHSSDPPPAPSSPWDVFSADAFNRLKERYRPDHDGETDAAIRCRILTAVSTMDFYEEFKHESVKSPGPFADRDILDALFQIRAHRSDLDDVERRLIEMARRRGITWQHISIALDVGTAQAAQQRHKRLADSTLTDPRVDPNAEID